MSARSICRLYRSLHGAFGRSAKRSLRKLQVCSTRGLFRRGGPPTSRSAPGSLERGFMSSAAPKYDQHSVSASAFDGVDPVVMEEFEIMQNTTVREHKAHTVLLKHKSTGAEIMSVQVPSEAGGDEKVFGVAFATPPEDSSGIAHVLEHSVLCGSRNYPIKEPFAELLRGSLQTFLNAMTYPDRTVYPVASMNTRDFYNLVGVYLDAVFFPRLGPHVLQQEGWRFESSASNGAETGAPIAAEAAGPGSDSSSSQLHYSGVVFNEMKGVYSSPDSLHGYACSESLFAGHTYGVSSGGDPLAIPTLDFEKFSAFHRRWYRPSNARLFFWGDDNPEDRLKLAHRYLTEAQQCRWAEDEEARSRQEAASHGKHIGPAVYPQGVVGSPFPQSPASGNTAASAGEKLVDLTPALRAMEPVPVPEDGRTTEYTAKDWEQFAGPLLAEAGDGEKEYFTTYPCEPSEVEAIEGAGDEGEGALPGGHGLYSTVCWALQDGGTDPAESPSTYLAPVERVGLMLLSSLLMGRQTSPLFKALVDSGLGTSVTGGGLSSYSRQSMFGAGLKGLRTADDAAKVRSIVMDTLARIAETGFDENHLKAEMNTLNFNLREFGAGGNPKGLTLFLGMAGSWLYGRDPVDEMRYEDVVAELTTKVENEPDFFQSLIRKHLLDNKHRCTVRMSPDPAMASELAKLEGKNVAKATAALPEDERASLAAQAEALRARQLEPDSPEDLATIPRLEVKDMEKTAKFTPWTTTALGASGSQEDGLAIDAEHMVAVEQPTNGISYAGLVFDLGHIPVSQLPALRVLSRCITSLGTSKMNEIEMQHRIGAETGGVSASASASAVPGSRGQIHAKLTVSGSALHDQLPALREILTELLLDPNLDQQTRVREILAQSESARASGAAGSAALAQSYVAGGLSAEGAFGIASGGLPYLRWLRKQLAGLRGTDKEQAWAALLADLQSLRSLILTRQGTCALVTSEKEGIDAAAGAMRGVLEALPVSPEHAASGDGAVVAGAFGSVVRSGGVVASDRLEVIGASLLNGTSAAVAQGSKAAVLVPTYVNYAVRQVPLPLDGSGGVKDLRMGAAMVGCSLASSNWIWDQVRVLGNAYGAGMGFDQFKGMIGFSSYRDPNIKSTFDAFSKSTDYLRGVSQDDVDKAIISVVGSLDSPSSPASKGSRALRRWMTGTTQEMVQQQRDEVLSASMTDMKQLADAIDSAMQAGNAREGVVSSSDLLRREGIEAASGEWIAEKVFEE